MFQCTKIQKVKRFIILVQWRVLNIFVATDISVPDNTFCLTFWKISLSEEWCLSVDERCQGQHSMLVPSESSALCLLSFPQKDKWIENLSALPHLSLFSTWEELGCVTPISSLALKAVALYFPPFTHSQWMWICLKKHENTLQHTCRCSFCILQIPIHTPGINYAIKSNVGKPWSTPELLQVNWS